MKATNAQILDAYSELASVKKVAQLFGMCGQSVHERLVRLNATNRQRVFTKAEEDRLRLDYSRLADEGRAKELARELGRTPQYLSRQAKRLGLTNQNRKRPYIVESTGINTRRWLQTNPHPRGMLGKSHSNETKDDQSNRSYARWHAMSKEAQIEFAAKSHRSWKAGWRCIGGRRIFARSRWEANYARYLDWLVRVGCIAAWDHEPRVFSFTEIKRNTRSFLVDFSITETDGSVAYHEVKGWMDPNSAAKIEYMKMYYPEVKLVVIDSRNYKALEKMVCRRIAGWEIS